jgi:hypothetical protein
MRLFLVLAISLLASQATAQTSLPCGDVESLSYTLRWELPEGAAATSFVLLRFPEGGQGESIALDGVTLAGGVFSAVVPGFQNDTPYTVSLIARNDQGDSAPSNTLPVPAHIRGVCPNGPPPAPRLLEIAETLETIAQELRGQ